MTGIYKIESPSGKVYIGQSWNINKRFVYHKSEFKCGQNTVLKKSFNKYGFDCHSFAILHELPSDITQKVLDDYEILYINLFKSVGVTLLNTKEGGMGGRHSEETLRKIGLTKIGNKNRLGKYHSEETKEKISNSRKGRYDSWNKGKEWDVEAKEKMSKARLGVEPWNKGLKNTISHTEDFKKAVSERSKNIWAQRRIDGAVNKRKDGRPIAAKLTFEQVQDIRSINTKSIKEMSLFYGVGCSAIRNIINGKSWI